MIKKTSYFILITVSIALVLTNSSRAQSPSQLGLPEGAKGRLVKGSISEIKYSPDGTKLAVASSIGIWIYDAHTGEELDLYRGHAGFVWSVSFSPDGTTLASGSYDGTVLLWNYRSDDETDVGESFSVEARGKKLTTFGQIKRNLLLQNYPNPFNPETWIPYQLANPAEVIITIYTSDGKLVRMLDVGHQKMGLYQNRSQAAYWNGKNMIGEVIASGVYFYTLTAGDFTATRRMLILK